MLQLLGELFREQQLGEKELGALVTLDAIYEVQQSALDADVQTTLARLFSHEEVTKDELAMRVARAVSLLELIQEQEPTTTTLVSQCLYSQLGMGSQESAVTEKLEKLRELGLLSYSEKLGYKIQSSAGQEWQRERDAYSVTDDEVSRTVREKLKILMGSVDRPRYKNKPFPWAAFYNDGKHQQDERLQGSLTDPAVITIDFRYLTNSDDRNSATWIQASATSQMRDRLIWVVGKLGDLKVKIRELARSQHMINKYEPRRQSLSRDKQRLLLEEQSRFDKLEPDVKTAIADTFVQGELYFRGRLIDQQAYGRSFTGLLEQVGESILPELYSQYVVVLFRKGWRK